MVPFFSLVVDVGHHLLALYVFEDHRRCYAAFEPAAGFRSAAASLVLLLLLLSLLYIPWGILCTMYSTSRWSLDRLFLFLDI